MDSTKDKNKVPKKKEKAPKHQAEISIMNVEYNNMTTATLYDYYISILLNTGAQMTMPGELIPPNAYTTAKRISSEYEGG